jgi:hypothetical protein
MVADPPEKHLRCQALVDAIQQLLDEARASLSAGELQRAATLELPLRRPEPTPRPFAVTEDLFPKRGQTRQADRAVRFVAAQPLVSRAAMRQRPSRHDERVDFVVGQTCLYKSLDCPSGKTILDEPDQIIVRVQAMNPKHLLHAFIKPGLLSGWGF